MLVTRNNDGISYPYTHVAVMEWKTGPSFELVFQGGVCRKSKRFGPNSNPRSFGL